MHPNFALIATQNSLKDSFFNKRQNLSYAFFSRFQKVTCEKFNEYELFEIVLRIKEKNNIKIDNNILQNIIKFHMDCEKIISKDSEEKFYFTIREIEIVLNALKNNNYSLFSIIMNVYGARFTKKEKEIMKLILEKYPNLKNIKEEEKKLPENFPDCFINENLIQAIDSILFSLNNQRHVIIIGEEE